MIGQNKTKNKLQKTQNSQFVLLVGEEGSGKKSMLKELYPDSIVLNSVKVEDIKEKLVNYSYKVFNRIFVVPDIDNMSQGATSALLKIAEEMPNNNRLIATVCDLNNVSSTLQSRAVIVQMDKYTPQQLLTYYQIIDGNSTDSTKMQLVKQLCSTPGEVNKLASMNDCAAFYSYVVKVIDNITSVSDANALKISQFIALKNENGYDLRLFWKLFILISMKCCYYDFVLTTSRYLTDLHIKGINKQMLFDTWILEIRGA